MDARTRAARECSGTDRAAKPLYATVTVMSLARAAAVVIALSLLGSPLAALYCNEADAAAMACCRRDMSHCNMPGKTEDCCRKVPASQESQTAALKAERIEKSRLGPLHHLPAVTPDLPVSVPRLDASLHASVPVRPSAAPSPPRSPILRV